VYINLLRTQDDMMKRPCGKCYLERTHLCRYMQEDVKRVMAEHYPRRGPDEVLRLADRVLEYLEHQMVIAICNVMFVIYSYSIQYRCCD
jgi:calcineurin-like phosphoesterase family protein